MNPHMPDGFWWGLVLLPAVVVLIAAIVSMVTYSIKMAANCGAGEYKLTPKLVRERPLIAATVACAVWVRYLWIPGWHIVICRTTMATKDSSLIQEQNRLMQRAIRGVFEQQQRRGVIDQGDF